jgi:hypothetical protein
MTIEELKEYLNKDDVVCALSTGDQVITSNLKGVRPWLKWLRECPELLEGAMVADKVVGKAAAMLMVVSKIKTVYTPLISEQALVYLNTQTLDVHYDGTVPYITNNDQSGLCPMETTVLNVTDAHEGHRLLMAQVAELMKHKS